MPRHWPNRLLRSLSKRHPSARVRSKKQRRRVLVESLEDRRLLAVVGFNESGGGDLDSDPAAPVFVLDSAGTNTWQGTLETPADASDGFRVDLNPAIHVTDVRVSYTDVDPGTDPDSGVEINGTGNGAFSHTFSGTELGVSVGGFDVTPYENSSGVVETFASILFEAGVATPAADWVVEIDTAIGPAITTAANASADENQTLAVDVDAADDLDAEGAGLTYSISGGADSGLFSIDATTGVLQFTSAPDFETIADDNLDNVYEVDVTATDSDGFDATQTFLISVNDVNEAPVAEAGGPYSIDAGLILNVDASGTTDPDAGDTLTYDWDLDDDGSVDFTTNAPVATIPWLTIIDHISVGSHSIRLTVTDSGGLSSTDTATLDISDLFIYPAVSDGTDDAYTLVISGADLEVNDSNTSTLLSRVPIADIVNIAIQGSSDVDTVTVDFDGGAISVPISFDGNLPGAPIGQDPLPPLTDPFPVGDSLVLVDGLLDDVLSVAHTFVNESTGSIGIDFDSAPSALIQYTGLEPIIDNLDADDREFTFTGGAETINLSDDGVLGDDFNRIDSTLGELVVFLNPTTSVTVNADTGADIVNLPDYDSSDPALVVNLSGGVGNDVINLGNPVDGLAEINAVVNVLGDDNDATPENSSSVTAKSLPVDVTIPSGDELNIIDSASAFGEFYALSYDDATMVTGIEASTHPANAIVVESITFETIETVTLETGDGDDDIIVADTAPATSLTITTADGNDTVAIDDTGDGSIVSVITGEGEDELFVTLTGDASVTNLETGNDNDLIEVLETGANSGLSVDTGLVDTGIVSVAPLGDLVTLFDTGAGSANLIETGDGSDVVNVQATGLSSATDIYTGVDVDTVNISSDAAGIVSASRDLMQGDPSGDLDGILGEICVFGEAPGPSSPGDTESVTAKLITVEQSYERQDELNISDEGNAAAQTYTLDATTFTRSLGGVSITYETIETLNIETGSDVDTFSVTDTADEVRTTLDTGDGNDDVDIASTGERSILIVTTGAGEDNVEITTTGEESVTRILTGDDNDTVLATSTGNASGLEIETGLIDAGSVSVAPFGDLVTLGSSGEDSATLIQTGDGTDVINLRGSGDGSATDVYAGTGADTINVSSDAAGVVDADRDLMQGDPTGTLDLIAGEICIYGEEPIITSPGITETITAEAGPTTVTVEQSYERGDELNISDEDLAAGIPTAHTYTLDTTTFSRTSAPVSIVYETIETLNIETGEAGDVFAVTDTLDEVRTTVDTGSGDDDVTVAATGDRSILVVATDAGEDAVGITITGADSITRVHTGSENDEVGVAETGVASGLEIDTADGDDLVEIAPFAAAPAVPATATGTSSATLIATGAGLDVINVRATGAGSAMEIAGGADDDAINLSSDADGAIDPTDRDVRSGTPEGVLDGLLGDISVQGEANTVDLSTETVMARQTVGLLVSASTDVSSGDDLNISDEGTVANLSYSVDATELQRTGLGVIEYETIETVNFETGQGDSTVAVATTADGATFNLSTFEGNDAVTIDSTGAGSVNSFDVASDELAPIADMDTVTINSTGDESVSRISTGDQVDTFNISSIGSGSGVQASTDDGNDIINLLEEPLPLPTRSDTAVIDLSAGDGEDDFDVDEVFLNTTVDAKGDAGDDTFTLTAAGADAAGYLERINNDPGGDDAVAATRQLLVDGGANDAGTNTITQGVTNNAGNPVTGTSSAMNVATGDVVEVDAGAAANALDLRYVVTSAAQGVLATTTPVPSGSPRNAAGNEVFESVGVETVDITSGSEDDIFTVSGDIPFDVNATETLVDFRGGGGTDKFEVVGGPAADFITVGTDQSPNQSPFEIDSVEQLRIDGNGGDDQISTQTATLGTLNGGDGNDAILGGSAQDLLTGGAGVDFLYGSFGEDVLITDQDFGSNAQLITDGEVLNGGAQDDVCIQLGLDDIILCEVVGDGGGRKDVLTWLRGIFIDPQIDLENPNGENADLLIPFEPVKPDPVALDSVSEPSQVPYALNASNGGNAVIHPRPIIQLPRFEATDVNQDGLISVRDALVVINYLGSQQFASSAGAELSRADRSKDVNGNGVIEPLDALMVINRIASAHAAHSEGEQAATAWAPAVDSVFADLDSDSDDEEQYAESRLF